MTELQQYKKAHSVMLGEIDELITSLEGAREVFKMGGEKGGQSMGMPGVAHMFVDSIILALTKTIQKAEAVFLDEDPTEE